MKENTKKVLLAVVETVIDMTIGSDRKRTEFKKKFDTNLKEVKEIKKVPRTCKKNVKKGVE